MISHISIKDFAIIERVDIDLHSGLNIITGETGAGKSIIIEALSLALGSRADTAYVRTGKEKAVIQIIAETDGEEYIITREVSAVGKSICRINDEIVSVATLNNLCKKLADIHGQYDHQSLLNAEQHLSIIDRYGDKKIGSRKKQVAELYSQYASIKKQLSTLLKDAAEAERKRDFLKFELHEIEEAKPYIDEDEELTSQLLLLQNGEKIQKNLSAAYDMLYDGSPSACEHLSKSLQLLDEIKDFSQDITQLADVLSDCYYKLDDLVSDLRKNRDTISFSEQELNETVNRLDLLETLKRKYGGTLQKVLDYAEQARRAIDRLERSDELCKTLKEQLIICERKLDQGCQALSLLRNQSAKELEEKVNIELDELNFHHAVLSTVLKQSEENNKKTYTENGIDQAEFLIITNKGEKPKPLAKIASGGEISRIMLALKSVTSEYDNIKTIVFDEIDSGISGITASIVGRKLLQIAKDKQIICITHLPQIAALGQHHFKIQKHSDEHSTHTNVVPLTHEEKVHEIARLLGGANITETTLKSAEELITLSKEGQGTVL